MRQNTAETGFSPVLSASVVHGEVELCVLTSSVRRQVERQRSTRTEDAAAVHRVHQSTQRYVTSVNHYLTTLSRLPSDSPPAGPVHQQALNKTKPPAPDFQMYGPCSIPMLELRLLFIPSLLTAYALSPKSRIIFCWFPCKTLLYERECVLLHFEQYSP